MIDLVEFALVEGGPVHIARDKIVGFHASGTSAKDGSFVKQGYLIDCEGNMSYHVREKLETTLERLTTKDPTP